MKMVIIQTFFGGLRTAYTQYFSQKLCTLVCVCIINPRTIFKYALYLWVHFPTFIIKNCRKKDKAAIKTHLTFWKWKIIWNGFCWYIPLALKMLEKIWKLMKVYVLWPGEWWQTWKSASIAELDERKKKSQWQSAFLMATITFGKFLFVRRYNAKVFSSSCFMRCTTHTCTMWMSQKSEMFFD